MRRNSSSSPSEEEEGKEETEAERRRREAVVQFRRIEATLQKNTQSTTAAKEAKPLLAPDSPIRRISNMLFVRMKKHEKHNPNFSHYYISVL
mmetsp:Transcript_54343/g.87981  ORF Transcript_54343/g.87981 Transcript_54343/m.87981 type:complete len:92 (+) Transcript_54343:175-450(+)